MGIASRRVGIMKYALLAAAIVAILAAPADAKLPPRGNISLYGDGARSYNAYCAVPWGYSIAKVEMWVWCQPGENGLWGVECAVAYPPNVVADRVTYNSGLAMRQGNLLEGISASFGTCQWDWSWIAHQALYVSSLQQTYLEVAPHPAVGFFRFFNCGEGNPAEPCLKGTNLQLNAAAAPCLQPETAIGTGGSTWGAVKDLFGE
jgi:hypothetical protein